MSLRAIKKRDSQLSSTSTPRPTLFKKATTTASSTKRSTAGNLRITTTTSANNTVGNLKKQYKLLGRATRSTPVLATNGEFQQVVDGANLLRSKSETDVSVVKVFSKTTHPLLTNAKSEVCLQSISSHNYEQIQVAQSRVNNNLNMISGARSHRDLSQSAYAGQVGDYLTQHNSPPRRMSECSMSYSQTSNSGYSQRSAGSMFASQLTLASNALDPNAVLRVPIIGYEVMEERARFTVYKLRVENPVTNDCWLVMRRYTDFVRLNSKLKQLYPNITLILPRKKLFGDNFNAVFLDNRVQGLQIFVNSVMSKEDLRNSKLVREFFCLDEPPSYSESMEECRAIFEAQEETIAHLKMQIQNKNDLILSLQQKLREEIDEKEQLKDTLKNLTLNCSNCSSANGSSSLI